MHNRMPISDNKVYLNTNYIRELAKFERTIGITLVPNVD